MKNPIRRASRAWMLALTLGPALAAPSPAAHAADYVTAMAGGGGGTQYHLPCKADEVLVGPKGRASALVDRVQALCAQVDPLGRWVGNPQARGAAGGTGGSAFTLSCPRDHAISGFQRRAATYIDQLRIRCGRLTAGPRLASIGSILAGQAGGAGGTAFGPFDCADGKPGIKVSGRAGGFVDSMQLVSNVPAAPLRPRDATIRKTGYH